MNANEKWELLKNSLPHAIEQIVEDSKGKPHITQDTVKGGIAAFQSIHALMQAIDTL